MAKLTRPAARKIALQIVNALNRAWPESIGDNQTYDDKMEAIEQSVSTMDLTSEEELDAFVMISGMICRPLPYEIEKPWRKS